MTGDAGPRLISVRPARPSDATALASMFGRCSDQTRYRRFHAPVREIPAVYLRRCLDGGPDAQTTFVAELVTRAGRRLVGFAGAGPVPGRPRVREAGVLVEDELQRQGVGRMLFAALSADARASGVETFRLEMCRSQPALLAYVLANTHVVAARSAGCDVTVDVTVPGSVTAGLTRGRSRAAGSAP